MQLVYRQSTQIIQKQRIQIQHNRIKNPNWQEATSWLLPSVAEDVNSRMTENNWKSSQWPEWDSNQGAVLRVRCSDHSACVGVHFSEVFPGYASALELVDQYSFPWKGLLLSQGSWPNWKLRHVDFLFFQGGGGLGLRDMYVCTQWQGSLQRRESVTEHENGVCESVHLYHTQRFTFLPKCFIPVATVRNETVTLTITSTWMSTASQL